MRQDAEGAHRPIDVLERPLAHILEAEIEPIADIVPDPSGDDDPARSRDAFEPRRHVDAVTIDVAGLDDHVADIDADAKLDAAVPGHAGVALAHAALDRRRARDRIHDARELRQEPVPGELDDTALRFGDLGVDQIRPVGFPGCVGARLVHAHEAAIGRHVSRQDGGQASVDRRLVHVTTLSLRRHKQEDSPEAVCSTLRSRHL